MLVLNRIKLLQDIIANVSLSEKNQKHSDMGICKAYQTKFLGSTHGFWGIVASSGAGGTPQHLGDSSKTMGPPHRNER